MVLSKRQKFWLGCLGLVISFILVGNSNNVPERFVERIFKSIIVSDHSMVHYSGFILIFVTYLSLKYLNEGHEFRFIKTGFRRFIVMVIIINLFSSMWSGVVKCYKSFATDLNTIYLERDATDVKFYESEGEVFLEGDIVLYNCSDVIQTFRLKIKVPWVAKQDLNEEYYVLDEVIELYPKTQMSVTLDQLVMDDDNERFSSYTVTAFEYVLYNDESESVFRGSITDYWFDELNSQFD
ncbi:MAG TPA: hypothetical protein DCY20_09880 [Firmicutes bacterium]|nr:hypothetical protein [Bacillota bacterium]